MKKDYLYDDDFLSFEKICGKKIKDIIGHTSDEFGDPIFKIWAIMFEDGSKFFVEGEHDCPYIIVDDDVNKIIKAINDEENKI